MYVIPTSASQESGRSAHNIYAPKKKKILYTKRIFFSAPNEFLQQFKRTDLPYNTYDTTYKTNP